MERTLSPSHAEAVTVDIDTVPVTLHLPRGATVFAVRGDVWITQERRLEDVFLSPGGRFDLTSAAPLVVSATRGDATLHIARPIGVCRRAALDVYDFARCRAQRLRREALSHAGAALSGLLRAGVARLRSALNTRTRLTTQ